MPPLHACLVGGAVRDSLLGIPGKDRDYVVIGETPERMAVRGFKPVGKDFPVFVDPQTGDEYALARTERKSGRGYKGFVFHYSPDVTLEDDLKRRDLTINAMARSPQGELIDPYNGERDLREGILRHVSEAFAEDPLRVLRVARFHARYGFRIADETMGLMRRIVDEGEIDHLVAERIWAELRTGLGENRPSLMFRALQDSGALARIFPALAGNWSRLCRTGPYEGASFGDRICTLLDECARNGFPLESRLAVVFDCEDEEEEAAVGYARESCARIRAPVRSVRYAETLARSKRLLRSLAARTTCESLLDALAALNWPRDRRLMKDTLNTCSIVLQAAGQDESVLAAIAALEKAGDILLSGSAAERIRSLGKKATREKVRGIRLDALQKEGLCD